MLGIIRGIITVIEPDESSLSLESLLPKIHIFLLLLIVVSAIVYWWITYTLRHSWRWVT